jgi:hypothetical protein
MPLAFPSHQGLLAPLWRRWPGRFGVLALWVGAIAPDVIDAVVSLAWRGHFGQFVGHSLIGQPFVALPGGYVLLAVLRRSAHAAAHTSGWRHRLGAWLAAVDDDLGARTPAAQRRRDLVAIQLGALSHVAFDLISHDHSLLLWPFAADPKWFGDWWRVVWFHLHLPLYLPYPVGPHFIAWLTLSAVGAAMFVWLPPKRR